MEALAGESEMRFSTAGRVGLRVWESLQGGVAFDRAA
jgi:hypothetical protein